MQREGGREGGSERGGEGSIRGRESGREDPEGRGGAWMKDKVIWPITDWTGRGKVYSMHRYTGWYSIIICACVPDVFVLA